MKAREHWSFRLVEPRALKCLAGFIAAGGAIYMAALAWAGWAAAVDAFERIGRAPLVAGACIASLGYLFRFFRWHYTLTVLGNPLRVLPNLQIYLGGLALTTTPGKAGEAVRSLLLMPLGVPVSRSLGAFFADRLSDVIGVCLLGAVAGCVAHGSLNVVGIFGVLAFVGSFVLRAVIHRPVWWMQLGERLPAKLREGGRFGGSSLLQWAIAWTPGNAFLFAAIAAFAYGLQAGVFAWFCDLLGMQMSAPEAVELYVNAILIGAASMVPAGLGTMEAALVTQLTARGASMSDAVSVAIAVRLVTLWVSLTIGIIAVLSVSKSVSAANE